MTSKGPKITLSNEKKVQEYRKEDKRVEGKMSDIALNFYTIFVHLKGKNA